MILINRKGKGVALVTIETAHTGPGLQSLVGELTHLTKGNICFINYSERKKIDILCECSFANDFGLDKGMGA